MAELSLDVGSELRRPGRPVFVTSNGAAVKGAQMTSAMYKAMSLLVRAERAKLFTWHSARISLATHLLRCKVNPATIQAILRWQTDESLRAYARLSMMDCAHLLDQAAAASIATVQTPNLPIFEKFDFFLAMHRLEEHSEQV